MLCPGLFLAVALLLLAIAPAAQAAPPFGIDSFSSRTTDEAEAPYTAAGGHPFKNQTAFEVSSHFESPGGVQALLPNEKPKDSVVTLEPGFIGNPAIAARCPLPKLGDPQNGTHIDSDCPPGSQIGTAVIELHGSPTELPIYNLPPEGGYPAQFGFVLGNVPMILSVVPLPRTQSYGLTIGSSSIPTAISLNGFTATFYGVPGQRPVTGPKDGSGGTDAPFLSNPLDCSNASPSWNLVADSWDHAGTYLPGGFPLADLSDPSWKTASEPAPPVTGCDSPLLAAQFDATTIATKPLQPGGGPTQADQPSGLQVDLDFPQSNDPTDLETEFEPETPQAPEPKDITVKLPAGLSISPSSADGLGACSDQASDPAGDQVHYDNTKPVTCPDSSKIGSAVATSPLLALRDPQDDTKIIGPEPIPGDVYLLAPHPGDLPPGGNSAGRFRFLIQLENPGAGINIKLPGVATADKDTGQLTMSFAGTPQLPSSHVQVSLKPGPRAPLATPVTCGSFQTTSDIVPWSTPGTPDATPSAGFGVTSGPNGSACAGLPDRRPFSPPLIAAGSDSAVAGAASPFTLKLTRNDGEQELSSLDLTTPKGFSAKLAGVPYCSEAAIAAAANRSGGAEAANPSCPAASQIGTVTAAAGPGPNPYYVNGKAYLSGPYKGAPLSFVFIAPATAGPFDLGSVVVRAAIFVDPETAQLTVRSDPLPRILDGLPLRLRSIAVNLDRPDFTRNPTSCEPMSINATVNGSNGASASPSNSFQASGCDKLGFKPKLALDLLGGLARGRHPALRAVLRAGSGEAAIAAATVTLPAGELLDLHRLPALCARKLPPERCPPASRLGQARVWSPLLAVPLEGPIYLREPSGQFPDLLADLRGAGLHFVLHGRTSAPPRHLRIRFPDLPDIPLTKAQFSLAGGRRGVVVNSEALCGRSRRATVSFSAHNGDLVRLRPLLRLRGRC